MRLINTSTLGVQEFIGDSAEEYAILSHTWGEDECTLQDMSTAKAQKQKGYTKIQLCCEQALLDGLNWAWVDTCCIDKTSTAELSEAINSMFRWYSNAKVCYAYLADVNNKHELASSRWFSRGWTLQELIAPKVVRFYSSDWALLGLKSEICDTLREITGIDASVLETGSFGHICVAKRMSWAARRETSRAEDRAYSLMGIFDVNMPLIYGEGTKAFMRLQQEILRVSDDQSLFAWGAPIAFGDIHSFLRLSEISPRNGLFAHSPMDFLTKHEILQAKSKEISLPPVIHGNGVRVQFPVLQKGSGSFIILACTTRNTTRAYIGVPVKDWDSSYHTRIGSLVMIFPEDWVNAESKSLLVKQPPAGTAPRLPTSFQILRPPNKSRRRKDDPYILDEVFCLDSATYHAGEHSISISPGHRGVCGALFFTFSAAFDLKAQSRDGIFPVRSFAVVLGASRTHPWARFLPILRDTHADADFHDISRHATELIRVCMTKRQLKDMLYQGDMARFQLRARRLDQLLCVWRVRPSNLTTYRNLQVSVSLDINHINLVDETIFVSVDIYEVDVCTMSRLPVFQHSHYDVYSPGQEPSPERARYYPDWLTIKDLEWFKE